jgi:hypothetical protein
MISTSPLPVSADPAVPPVPSLSLVPAPRLAVVPAGSPAAPPAPAALFAAPRSGRPVTPRPVAPVPDPSEPSALPANRPRFRRLVVFTGQLS